MQYFLDHIASIMIVSVVLLIIVVVQVRGTQSAAESTINNMVYNDVVNISSFLKRDLENMLTQPQAADAETAGRYTYASSGGVTLCTGVDSTTGGIHSANHTVSFRFPTLADPDNPLTSNVIEVEYDLVKTGKTITLPTQDSTQTIPLFRLNRVANGVFSGASEDAVTAFRIEALEAGDRYNAFTRINGGCTVDLRKVRFEFKMAQDGVDMEARKSSTSQTNISRFGATVHLSNWD